MNKQIVIVGAGLSGLHAASLLTARGIKCKVLEARDRIGGRILTTSDSNRPDLGDFDIGSTWFWPHYEKTITNLVNKLNLKTFDQYTNGEMLSERYQEQSPDRFMLPEDASARSARFAGGVQSLVDAIANTIPSGVVGLNKKVTAIRQDKAEHIVVEADCADGKIGEFSASAVILALPPRIVADKIEFSPSLPSNVMNDLMNKPTWMAGQAKVVVVYERPFWREQGLSGFVSSMIGPMQEIHDASTEVGSYALFGFLGIPAKIRQELGEKNILEMITDQLVRLFGSDAKNPSAILYKDWSEDSETAVDADLEPLRAFPNYGQPPNVGVWEKGILFAGTENSPRFGGHLEGALHSAEQAVYKIVYDKDQSLS